MKLFKLFISLFLIAILTFVVSLFFPRSYRIERSIKVNVPVDKAYSFMQDFRNWEQWSLWNKSMDSTLYYFYGRTSAGQGGRQYFYGNALGSGRFLFDTCITNQQLKYSLYMHGGEVNTQGEFQFSGNTTEATITWINAGDVGYNPLYRFMIPSKISSTEKVFDDGLGRIKNILESKNP
ncbi:MAG: hypothetical protein WC760_12500 [Bacteroidia bacterium]|jgi:hypothetical protein